MIAAAALVALAAWVGVMVRPGPPSLHRSRASRIDPGVARAEGRKP